MRKSAKERVILGLDIFGRKGSRKGMGFTVQAASSSSGAGEAPRDR